MTNVHLVKLDDWQALYIDGRLARESHRLRPEDVLEALGVDFQELWLDEDVDFGTRLPESFDELQQLLEKDK